MKETEEAKTSTSKPKRSIFSHFETNEHGVYQINRNDDGESSGHWIAPPIYIDALTHDSSGENYGHLVRFRNQNDHEKTCILLYSELIEGLEAPQRLFNLGFKASEKRKDLESLRHYILQSNPATTICAVPSHGWHAGVFVRNDDFDLSKNGANSMILDPNVAAGHRYNCVGTLEDWQTHVGQYCQGNTRLVLAVSAAFAAPLLHLLKAPNIGIHLRGISSIGKTTALYTAGSVWGGGGEDNNVGFIQSWRATANGLELQCALHNDALLCLDEISLCNEKEIGDIVYCLGNGIGKRRATRDIRSRPVIQFRLVFLSCGERSLREMMANAGKRTKGGQESRLIDIPADAGHGTGIFEDLHGYENGAKLANYLTEAAKTYYGAPAFAWTEWIQQHPEEAAERTREGREAFVRKLHLAENGASGEAYRVADSIGFIAAAGEIATKQGFTGWDPEEYQATAAANININNWRQQRGGTWGAHDVQAGMRHLASFLLSNAYRFQSIKQAQDGVLTPQKQAGYWEEDAADDCRLYFINTETFQTEICQDYNHELILQELEKHDLLVTNKCGQVFCCKKRIPGHSSPNFYAVKSTICEIL